MQITKCVKVLVNLKFLLIEYGTMVKILATLKSLSAMGYYLGQGVQEWIK